MNVIVIFLRLALWKSHVEVVLPRNQLQLLNASILLLVVDDGYRVLIIFRKKNFSLGPLVMKTRQSNTNLLRMRLDSCPFHVHVHDIRPSKRMAYSRSPHNDVVHDSHILVFSDDNHLALHIQHLAAWV